MKIWTEISAERLKNNFSALQRILAQESGSDASASHHPALLAVVKANAYGHGIDPCAAILAAAGAEWLGVTDAHEGATVRGVLAAAGIPDASQPRVLVMSGTAALPGEAASFLRHRLTPVVGSVHQIAALAAAARDAGLRSAIDIHLEIDSGMSRQGIPSGAGLSAILDAIAAEPRIALDGILTHFASTEVAHSAQTAAQQKNFETALARLAASGAKPGWVHVGNSSYIDNGSCSEYMHHPIHWLQSLAGRVGARAMVRSGLALYGYVLPIEGAPLERPATPLAQPHVLPVMTWKTRIIGISEVPASAAIGYNGTYIAQKPMRLALLPAGYADGLRRELSSSNTRQGGWAIIHGQRAPIVGRVSMNLTSVDITNIDAVAEGDEAVLLGHGLTAHETISAQDHARLANTIPYEILCGVRTSP